MNRALAAVPRLLTLISPYGQFCGLATPGSSKGTWKQELVNQLLDIKQPTELQRAGERYGEWFARREEMKRAARPRGPIEYTARRLQRQPVQPSPAP